MFCCLRGVLEGFSAFSSDNVSHQDLNPIILDTNHIGHEVVIVKNGCRICGGGGAMASAPLVQSKSYFEVKVQQCGVWGIGLGTTQAQLDKAPGGSDKDSWILCSDGNVRNSNEEIGKVTDIPQEGDIVGVSYDHIELNFYSNGKNLNVPVSGIRGTVFPLLYVDDGAILDFITDSFSYPPPPGFEKIMLEQSLL